MSHRSAVFCSTAALERALPAHAVDAIRPPALVTDAAADWLDRPHVRERVERLKDDVGELIAGAGDPAAELLQSWAAPRKYDLAEKPAIADEAALLVWRAGHEHFGPARSFACAMRERIHAGLTRRWMRWDTPCVQSTSGGRRWAVECARSEAAVAAMPRPPLTDAGAVDLVERVEALYAQQGYPEGARCEMREHLEIRIAAYVREGIPLDRIVRTLRLRLKHEQALALTDRERREACVDCGRAEAFRWRARCKRCEALAAVHMVDVARKLARNVVQLRPPSARNSSI